MKRLYWIVGMSALSITLALAAPVLPVEGAVSGEEFEHCEEKNCNNDEMCHDAGCQRGCAGGTEAKCNVPALW